jgi:hypothetical protein
MRRHQQRVLDPLSPEAFFPFFLPLKLEQRHHQQPAVDLDDEKCDSSYEQYEEMRFVRASQDGPHDYEDQQFNRHALMHEPQNFPDLRFVLKSSNVSNDFRCLS